MNCHKDCSLCVWQLGGGDFHECVGCYPRREDTMLWQKGSSSNYGSLLISIQRKVCSSCEHAWVKLADGSYMFNTFDSCGPTKGQGSRHYPCKYYKTHSAYPPQHTEKKKKPKAVSVQSPFEPNWEDISAELMRSFNSTWREHYVVSDRDRHV